MAQPWLDPWHNPWHKADKTQDVPQDIRGQKGRGSCAHHWRFDGDKRAPHLGSRALSTAEPVSKTDFPAGVDAPGRAQIAERTLRPDRWWLEPLLTFIGLSSFVLYGVIRTATQSAYFIEGAHYSYLSPFASPCVSSSCVEGSSHFGHWFGTFPQMIPLAIVTLPFLLGFRLTCYYYRKAYYRSFWLSPPACAVPEPKSKYTGETRFPLLAQNLHRYFWAMAVLISVVNTYDAIKAFHGTQGFGFGLGNVILVANVLLLWAYTLGCHSCRHITAGRINNFSKHPVRYWLWGKIGVLNGRHMNLAWTTLATLVLTDFYIMLVSAGTISDLRFIG